MYDVWDVVSAYLSQHSYQSTSVPKQDIQASPARYVYVRVLLPCGCDDLASSIPGSTRIVWAADATASLVNYLRILQPTTLLDSGPKACQTSRFDRTPSMGALAGTGCRFGSLQSRFPSCNAACTTRETRLKAPEVSEDVKIDQEEFEELWVEKAEKVAAKKVGNNNNDNLVGTCCPVLTVSLANQNTSRKSTSSLCAPCAQKIFPTRELQAAHRQL